MTETTTKPLTEADAYAWAVRATRHVREIDVEPHLLQRLADSVASAILAAQERGAASARSVTA